MGGVERPANPGAPQRSLKLSCGMRFCKDYNVRSVWFKYIKYRRAFDFVPESPDVPGEKFYISHSTLLASNGRMNME